MLTPEEKSDLSYKQLNSSKVSTNTRLLPYEESNKTDLIVFPENIWTNAKQIPASGPTGYNPLYPTGVAVTTGTSYTYSSPTGPWAIKKWVYHPLAYEMGSNYAFRNTVEPVKNIMDFNLFGPEYEVSLYYKEGSTFIEIPFGLGEWVVNQYTGVVTFYGDLPEGVGVSGNLGDLYITAYTYEGPFGISTGLGPQGPTGPAGGPTGPQGGQGYQGNQGSQGQNGPVGPPGSQGSQGIQGLQGLQGLQGTQGSIGTQGIQGSIGVRGYQGFQGFQGPQGFQGHQGFQGQQGAQGIQGIQGIQGGQGPYGFQGQQGSQGIQGQEGPTGPIGPTGSQGDSGPQGPAGPTGTIGPTGSQGDSGPQGPIGPIGLTGSQGNFGPQGPIGPAGTCPCPTMPMYKSTGPVSIIGSTTYNLDSDNANMVHFYSANSTGYTVDYTLSSTPPPGESYVYTISNVGANTFTVTVNSGASTSLQGKRTLVIYESSTSLFSILTS